MSEKLTESITFKCTDSTKEKALKIFKAKKFESLSEYINNLLIRDIAEVESYLNDLLPVMGLTTYTVDTSFELTAPPRIIDITPQKQQAQKKPNCCDQLSLIAVHTEI